MKTQEPLTQEQIEAMAEVIKQATISMGIAMENAREAVRSALDHIQPAVAQGLKELRMEDGMTQKQVAEYIGVSTDTVKRWETGETFPTAKDIVKLEQLYRTRFEQMDFGLKEQPKQ